MAISDVFPLFGKRAGWPFSKFQLDQNVHGFGKNAGTKGQNLRRKKPQVAANPERVLKKSASGITSIE